MSVIARLAVPPLVELGFSEEDARTRVALLRRVVRHHEQAAGRPPQWCWFVPGRVEVFGKHTDYAGGRSLVAAVPRGFGVAAGPRIDGQVHVCDAATGEERLFSVVDVRALASGWANYVRAVVRRLALNFPGADLGADITIASDLPRAAGLSSSSALVVGVAMALARRASLETRPEWRDAIRTPLDLAGYLGALERGAAYASLDGTDAVGVFGGSEDQTAILTCRAETVSAYRYVPVQAVGDARMPGGWRFVIASSGVSADKGGGVRDLYNAASLAAEALVTVWNDGTGESRGTLAEIAASSPGAVDHLRAMVASGHGTFGAEVLARRLSHFIAEDGRVPLALQALREANETALGELSRGSQVDAETLLQNQTDETSALARLAREHGAFAACTFGAGFGGSVWALAPAGEAASLGERWVAAYRARFPHRSLVTWFAARPGPGMIEIQIDARRPGVEGA